MACIINRGWPLRPRSTYFCCISCAEVLPRQPELPDKDAVLLTADRGCAPCKGELFKRHTPFPVAVSFCCFLKNHFTPSKFHTYDAGSLPPHTHTYFCIKSRLIKPDPHILQSKLYAKVIHTGKMWFCVIFLAPLIFCLPLESVQVKRSQRYSNNAFINSA